MLHNLVQNGANNIWEHELYNTSSKSSSYPPKPSPSDKLRFVFLFACLMIYDTGRINSLARVKH